MMRALLFIISGIPILTGNTGNITKQFHHCLYCAFSSKQQAEEQYNKNRKE